MLKRYANVEKLLDSKADQFIFLTETIFVPFPIHLEISRIATWLKFDRLFSQMLFASAGDYFEKRLRSTHASKDYLVH